HGVNDAADAADAQGHEVQRQGGHQQGVEEGVGGHAVHLTRRTMPKADSRLAATSSRGTCISRSRATTDSTTPISTASSRTPARNTPQSAQGLPVANGSTSRTSRAANKNSFRAAP